VTVSAEDLTNLDPLRYLGVHIVAKKVLRPSNTSPHVSVLLSTITFLFWLFSMCNSQCRHMYKLQVSFTFICSVITDFGSVLAPAQQQSTRFMQLSRRYDED